MIDAKRYLRLKPKGVTKVIKDNGDFALMFKRYDVETGVELELPELQPFTLQGLHERAIELATELEGVNQVMQAAIDYESSPDTSTPSE